MTAERKLLSQLAAHLINQAKASDTIEPAKDGDGAWIHSTTCPGACDYACGAVWIGYTTDDDGCVTITDVQNAGTLGVALTERVDPGSMGEAPLAAAPAEQPGVVNLTKLAAARSKMTPGEYQVTNRQVHLPDANAAWHTIDQASPGVESIVQTMANQAPQSIANAAGLVATHNAAPVLIEVARAAKQVVLSCATSPASKDEATLYSTACKELASALAKVSL